MAAWSARRLQPRRPPGAVAARRGHNALLVPPDDPDALAAALARLAREPCAAGAAGRRRPRAGSCATTPGTQWPRVCWPLRTRAVASAACRCSAGARTARQHREAGMKRAAPSAQASTTGPDGGPATPRRPARPPGAPVRALPAAASRAAGRLDRSAAGHDRDAAARALAAGLGDRSPAVAGHPRRGRRARASGPAAWHRPRHCCCARSRWWPSPR